MKYFLKFLASLPTHTRIGLLSAAALYLGGAIGLDLALGGYGQIHEVPNMPTKLITTVEDCLEMTGIIVFIGVLLHYVEVLAKNRD